MGHTFKEAEDAFIKEKYSSMTIKEIADSLDLTEAQIRHRIQRHLKIIPSKQRKHFINKDYFKKWSKNMSYILGLICADGNLYNDNYRNKGKVSISLATEDRQLLEDIALGMETDIGVVKDRSTCKQSELTVYNMEIYNDLIQLGLSERKSLTLKWLSNVPEEYQKDFLRGYFDGDGSLTFQQQSKNSKKVVIQFLGTDDFLKGISKTIENHLGIKYKDSERTQTKIKCLRYRTKQARDILEWMYEGSHESLYMIRKRDRYYDYKNTVQRLSRKGVELSEFEKQGSVSLT